MRYIGSFAEAQFIQNKIMHYTQNFESEIISCGADINQPQTYRFLNVKLLFFPTQLKNGTQWCTVEAAFFNKLINKKMENVVGL